MGKSAVIISFFALGCSAATGGNPATVDRSERGAAKDDGAADSCLDRCGDVDEERQCQCDDECEEYGDCCDDLVAMCESPAEPTDLAPMKALFDQIVESDEYGDVLFVADYVTIDTTNMLGWALENAHDFFPDEALQVGIDIRHEEYGWRPQLVEQLMAPMEEPFFCGLFVEPGDDPCAEDLGEIFDDVEGKPVTRVTITYDYYGDGIRSFVFVRSKVAPNTLLKFTLDHIVEI